MIIGLCEFPSNLNPPILGDSSYMPESVTSLSAIELVIAFQLLFFHFQEYSICSALQIFLLRVP